MSALLVAPPGLEVVPGGLRVLPRRGRAVPYFEGRPGRRAATYTRVSDDADNDAAAVARFVLACHDLAGREDLDVVYDFQDNDVAVSGEKRKVRPDYETLLRWIEEGRIDYVIAPAQDRIVRRMSDLVRLADTLEKANVALLTTQSGTVRLDTTEGRATAMIVGAMAEAETRRMGDRLKAKNRQLVAEGWWRGGPAPYGYRVVRAENGTRANLVIVEEEAEILREIVRRVLRERSLYGTAVWLNESETPPPSSRRSSETTGSGWSRQQLRRLLTSPTIAGRISIGREIAGVGNWLPIVSFEDWTALQDLLRDPSRQRRGPVHDYLLTGVLFHTGRPMVGRVKDGVRRYIRIEADGVANGAGFTINAGAVEAIVVEALLRKSDDGFAPDDPTTLASVEAMAEADRIREEIAQLNEARRTKSITMASFLATLTELEGDLAEVEKRIRIRTSISEEVERILATPGALRSLWTRYSFEEKRDVVRNAIERVEIVQTDKGRARFDPNRVASITFRGEE